jgi:hypothetical protein
MRRLGCASRGSTGSRRLRDLIATFAWSRHDHVMATIEDVLTAVAQLGTELRGEIER